jgi:hypothetical protein
VCNAGEEAETIDQGAHARASAILECYDERCRLELLVTDAERSKQLVIKNATSSEDKVRVQPKARMAKK